MNGNLRLPGATYLGDGRCFFRVWAPHAEKVAVHLTTPRERTEMLLRGEGGYHQREVTDVEPGSLYKYVLDAKKELPDPASRYQPEGVHGPSQVTGPGDFSWTDGYWFGPARHKLVFYELHVGIYTPEGTFTAVIPHLKRLRELGITALELMPVAQFPGSRNWGYDGVFPFAVQNTYGGPDGLKQLVNACHECGLAVFVDVVYNHLGPEGNYLRYFGPYFTGRYRTPWGDAVNFDGPGSDEVRRFFIANALYWLQEFHIDGLRLDAVHAITDKSAYPFLEELSSAVRRQAEKLGRRIYVIAESDLNDPRIIRPATAGGFGIDGQWTDDFHHALHALLTKEESGYYQDFVKLEHMARAFREGYVYTGQYSAYRRRRHGRLPLLCTASQFVVFTQNHDQVGNRAFGRRLSTMLSFEGLKLAAGVMLLSPFTPLLFMGEEYGETAPFQYFTSHSDPELVEKIRRGRQEEFAAFKWEGTLPDPQDETTFLRSRLNHGLRRQGQHRVLYEFYRLLLHLRREIPALADLNRKSLEATVCGRGQVLFVRRWSGDSEVGIIFSFSRKSCPAELPLPAGSWHKRLDAADKNWLGGGGTVPGSLKSGGGVRITLEPRACVLFERIEEA